MALRRAVLALALGLIVFAAVVRAADPSGRWAATFQTEVGEQQYTYEFTVKGTTLSGTAKGNLLGESKIQDGKIDGNTITFVELGKFQDMELRITYTGTMTSADEIAFTRNVADFAMEKLVAKRIK